MMISASMDMIQFLGLLLGVSLVIDLIGFYKTVWFISLGYSASIAAFVLITVGLVGTEQLVRYYPLVALQLLACLIWGVRLGLFLFARERKLSYQASVKDRTDGSQSVSIFVKACIWSSTSLLYVCMFSPVVFLAESSSSSSSSTSDDNNNNAMAVTTMMGVAITWFGLILESWADHQKSEAKAGMSRNTFVSSGLYSWVRCPNYLGEILFWTGIFVSGLQGIYKGRVWWHWLSAVTGWVCIILIMMGSTKRLESKQAERYGEDPAFKKYVTTVPVLFPWIPVYSLRNVKVYLE